MGARIKLAVSLPTSHAVISILLMIFLNLEIPFASADTADYFYDDLGRLSRVVKGTSGVIYKYDELGNLLSVTSATTTAGAPTLTGINPNVLFVGSKMLVAITGQNLLTTDRVTANGGLIAISNIAVTDTQITAEMAPISAGSETITVTTRSGGTATINVTLSSSTLALSPGQLAIAPGMSGTLTAAISPPLASPLTVNLNSSAPLTATVPQSVTIPAGGTATFSVNGLQAGVATIDAGDPRAVVFVTSSFTGDVSGLTTGNISVYIDAPAGSSPAAATPVSVYLDAPAGTSPSVAAPVSVYMDAAAGTSPSMTSPVSVYIDAPAGESPTVSGGVSVKIQ